MKNSMNQAVILLLLTAEVQLWVLIWTSIFVSSVNGEKESPTLFLPASLLSIGSGGLGFGLRRGGLFDAVAMFPVCDCFKNLL